MHGNSGFSHASGSLPRSPWRVALSGNEGSMNTEAHMSRNANARRICRSIMDAVTDVIVIFDSKTHRVLDVNKKATDMYGYSSKELLGKQLRELSSDFPDPS